MRLSISRNAAFAAAFAAIAARVFLGLALDAPSGHNGAWLAALLAMLPAVPWLVCLDGLSRTDSAGVGFLHAALLAVTVLDSALVLVDIGRSAGYLALDNAPFVGLMLPALLLALWSCRKNGDSVGYGAMLWLRLFPLLLALVVGLQARRFRTAWLTPLLGGDGSSLRLGTAWAAGCFVAPSAVLLLAEKRADRRGAPAWLPATASAAAALLLLFQQMMTPAQIASWNWQDRLDALLTNGRAPLYLQLPMIALWYAGLFHLLSCECFAAAALLQRLLPRLDGRLCAALTVACTGLIASTCLVSAALDPWLYPAAALVAALTALISPKRKGGEKPCVR